ncbi:hypothetical protein M422DRAFT_239453 [Sphaerobolus stellatus SS14]|nr:hypothetical protein M422DRAFT_239453 [Sphaerobolus stellatus SS14]
MAHLRDYVKAEMQLQDPDGFITRQPGSKVIKHYELVVLGPHQEWSGIWLSLWVIPNNWLKVSIAYLYLTLIEELGSMPVQTTTDCGTEVIRVFTIANILREVFSLELLGQETPAHRLLYSVNNITIERGWLQLCLQWGDNIHTNIQWLWPKLIQQELDELHYQFNNHRVRKDHKKILPSGIRLSVALALHEEHGAENFLQPIDRQFVQELKEALGGEE